MCKHLWLAVTVVLYAESSMSAGYSAPAPPAAFPPWQGETPPAAHPGVAFMVPEVDNMPDFHGNPTAAEFVVFPGGNYFFALEELVDAFERQKPELRGRIFFETIPPGIIERQLENRNTITVGNLTFRSSPTWCRPESNGSPN